MATKPTPSHFTAFKDGIDEICDKEDIEKIAPIARVFGRNGFEQLAFGMLNDTPYTQGIKAFAGWNSSDDLDRARGSYFV